MAQRKVVKRATKPKTVEQFIDDFAKAEAEKPKEEKVEVVLPHISEIFSMKFMTDNGDIVGIRRGMKLGSIEFYPVQNHEPR